MAAPTAQAQSVNAELYIQRERDADNSERCLVLLLGVGYGDYNYVFMVFAVCYGTSKYLFGNIYIDFHLDD